MDFIDAMENLVHDADLFKQLSGSSEILTFEQSLGHPVISECISKGYPREALQIAWGESVAPKDGEGMGFIVRCPQP